MTLELFKNTNTKVKSSFNFRYYNYTLVENGARKTYHDKYPHDYLPNVIVEKTSHFLR